MSNIKKYIEGHSDGMINALSIVDKEGVEALRSRIANKRRSGIYMTLTESDQRVIDQMLRKDVQDLVVSVALLALYEEFRLSNYQMEKYLEGFCGIMQKIGDHQLTLEEVDRKLEEKGFYR